MHTSCFIMNKIGIITHYYKSTNYGGVLQAYCLTDFLLNNDYDAEQICYLNQSLSIKHIIIKTIRKVNLLKSFILYYKYYKLLKLRETVFDAFTSDYISHSSDIYNNDSISKMKLAYGTYITGSDQVWHPLAVSDAYLLNFKRENIRKISYAASIAQNSINDNIKQRYHKALLDYKAISVREKDAVNIIQPLTELKVEWVLDPVFLKSKNEWENLAISRNINNKYIFCYFLGDSISHRKLAREYAEKKGLKIVTLPFLTNKYRECDADFGDYRLYDVSPFEFVGLIKDAEYVFTDSFHAVAFSTILEKEFVVFERNAKNSMGSRIRSITDLAGVSERYCYNQERCSLNYILELSRINYTNNRKELDAMISKSKDFLLTNLGDKG